MWSNFYIVLWTCHYWQGLGDNCMSRMLIVNWCPGGGCFKVKNRTKVELISKGKNSPTVQPY